MDEPVFLLRAQDMFAPDTLQAWLDAAKEFNKTARGKCIALSTDAPRTIVAPRIIDRVEQMRTEMMIWQRTQKVKVPDSPGELKPQANRSLKVRVRVGAKEIAKILETAMEDGETVAHASLLLTGLAKKAQSAIGALMVQAGHATVSYEQLPDGTHAMVGRCFDQEVIVRMTDQPAVNDDVEVEEEPGVTLKPAPKEVMKQCPVCNGTGETEEDKHGQMYSVTCRKCNGTGEVLTDEPVEAMKKRWEDQAEANKKPEADGRPEDPHNADYADLPNKDENPTEGSEV